MASLWKHPKSKFWVACFTDHTGRQRKRSTKTTNRRDALKIAAGYEDAGNRKRTSIQVRGVIAELHQEITGDELSSFSTKKFVNDWLEQKKPEIASATHTYYKNATDKFLVFLGEDAKREISEITRDHITRFRNHEAKSLAAKTVNHDLKCLKMVFKAARRDGVIFEDPTEFVETMRQNVKNERRRPFTIPELKAILSVADDEWSSMILFGLYTGQRLGDLAKLTWQNIDLQRGEIRLVTSKTGRNLIIPIAAPLRKRLESSSPGDIPDAPIHPKAYSVMHTNGRSGLLSNWFADLLAEAGLREKKKHRKSTESVGRGRRSSAGSLSFHSLRHTAVSMMKDAGMPMAAVMELVGHDSEQISEHYTHVGFDSLQKAADSLPDILTPEEEKKV